MSFYLGIYKKIDGLMHPDLDHDKLKQLQSKNDSHKSWFKELTKKAAVLTKFVRKHVTSSDIHESKQPPVVKIYLTPYCKFITGETSLNLNPLEAIDEIVYIIESLIKRYFFVESKYCCVLSSDAKKVYSYM